MRPLNDAVDGVVNERDAGRVRAEQVGVDGSGEGTGDALQPGELAEHVTHRVGRDSALDVDGRDVAALDARPEAPGQ